MPKRKQTCKNKTIATVCRYVMEQQGATGRAMARRLDIHHKTWQRYLHGEMRPMAATRDRLASLMQVEDFLTLVRQAYQHYYEPK